MNSQALDGWAPGAKSPPISHVTTQLSPRDGGTARPTEGPASAWSRDI